MRRRSASLGYGLLRAVIPPSETSPSAPRVSRARSQISYAVAFLVALVLLGASLLIPQPIQSTTNTAHYGKPFWFLESDMNAHGSVPLGDSDARWRLNPWENPTVVEVPRLLLSYGALAVVCCGAAWLLLRMAGRFQHRRCS